MVPKSLESVSKDPFSNAPQIGRGHPSPGQKAYVGGDPRLFQRISTLNLPGLPDWEGNSGSEGQTEYEVVAWHEVTVQ